MKPIEIAVENFLPLTSDKKFIRTRPKNEPTA
jgi:hypothetical protein